MSQSSKITILGRESILVDSGLWYNYVAQDLIATCASTTYIIITDSNIGLIYLPSFKQSFADASNGMNPAPSPPCISSRTPRRLQVAPNKGRN